MAEGGLHITIDGQRVAASVGETVLDVARRVGVRIPTLCDIDGLEPLVSCYLCLVRIEGVGGFQPACDCRVVEDMVVTATADDIAAARRVALELLLSDHVGECEAPCEMACPTGWHITDFMMALQKSAADAEAMARDGLALPATLGWVCNAPCERACRRGEHDETVSIKQLHRFTAERDAASHGGAPKVPEVAEETGKRVAIVGAGPAGLAAAYRLRQWGHGVVLYDAREEAGGSLLDLPEAELPAAVLQAEVALLFAMGAVFEPGRRLGGDLELLDLQRDFDAVLLTVGETGLADAGLADEGMALGGKRVADPLSRQTRLPGVFAAGAVAGRSGLAVRAVADGFTAAHSIDRLLRQGLAEGPVREAVVRYGKLADPDRVSLLDLALNKAARNPRIEVEPAAADEASRCMLCGCRGNSDCTLRTLSTELGANTRAFPGERRAMMRDDSHPVVSYQSHKCVLCGACVVLSERSGVGLGLTVVGRGFESRVAPPWDADFAEAVDDATAVACAAACPTAAIRLKPEAGGKIGAGC